MTKNELKVKALENGTVIDHINHNSLFKIIAILGLDNLDTEIFIGNNLESKKLGRKAIIKIANKFPSEDDLNKIAIIDSNVVINIIKDYEIVKKYNVTLPENISGFVRCINPKCVTNFEKIPTKFSVVRKNNNLELICKYCEKSTNQDNIEIIF